MTGPFIPRINGFTNLQVRDIMAASGCDADTVRKVLEAVEYVKEPTLAVTKNRQTTFVNMDYIGSMKDLPGFRR
jgi:hypothetical protein